MKDKVWWENIKIKREDIKIQDNSNILRFMTKKEIENLENNGFIDPITEEILEDPYIINYQQFEKIEQQQFDTSLKTLTKKQRNINLDRRYNKNTIKKLDGKDPYTRKQIISKKPDDKLKKKVEKIIKTKKRKIIEMNLQRIQRLIKKYISIIMLLDRYKYMTSIKDITIIEPNVFHFGIEKQSPWEPLYYHFYIVEESLLRKKWREKNSRESFKDTLKMIYDHSISYKDYNKTFICMDNNYLQLFT